MQLHSGHGVAFRRGRKCKQSYSFYEDTKLKDLNIAKGTNGYYSLGRFYPSKEIAERETAKIVERREKLAGRKLSLKEHETGIQDRPNDIDRHNPAHFKLQNFKPIPLPKEETPYWMKPDFLEDKTQKPYRRSEHRKHVRRQKEQEMQAAEAEAEAKQSPEVQQTQAMAAEILETCMFSPSVPQSILLKARNLKAQAETGNVGPFADMLEDFKVSYATFQAEAKANSAAEIEALKQDFESKKSALNVPDLFAPKEKPKEEEKPKLPELGENESYITGFDVPTERFYKEKVREESDGSLTTIAKYDEQTGEPIE